MCELLNVVRMGLHIRLLHNTIEYLIWRSCRIEYAKLLNIYIARRFTVNKYLGHGIIMPHKRMHAFSVVCKLCISNLGRNIRLVSRFAHLWRASVGERCNLIAFYCLFNSCRRQISALDFLRSLAVGTQSTRNLGTIAWCKCRAPQSGRSLAEYRSEKVTSKLSLASKMLFDDRPPFAGNFRFFFFSALVKIDAAKKHTTNSNSNSKKALNTCALTHTLH